MKFTLAQMVAEVMGAVAVFPLCLIAAWPLSAVQSQQPISHFDWHASSAAWPLRFSGQPVSHFDWGASSAAWPLCSLVSAASLSLWLACILCSRASLFFSLYREPFSLTMSDAHPLQPDLFSAAGLPLYLPFLSLSPYSLTHEYTEMLQIDTWQWNVVNC